MEREDQTSRSLKESGIDNGQVQIRLYSTSKDGIQDALVNMGEEP